MATVITSTHIERTCDPAKAIREFIRKYKSEGCNFVFCTGTASISGLHTVYEWVGNNKCTIILGKIDDPSGLYYGAQQNSRKREKVLSFLSKSDVIVYHYAENYDCGDFFEEKVAHGKAVIAYKNKEIVDALVGSPNLTWSGLYKNYELIVPVYENVFPLLHEYVKSGTVDKYKATDLLIELIEACDCSDGSVDTVDVCRDDYSYSDVVEPEPEPVIPRIVNVKNVPLLPPHPKQKISKKIYLWLRRVLSS